jgi:hypothetical protein
MVGVPRWRRELSPKTTDRTPVPVPATPVTTSADLTVVVHQAARAFFGALAIGAELIARGLAESGAQGSREAERRATVTREAADLVLALGWRASHVTSNVVERVLRVTGPVVSVALDPPLVPHRLAPSRFLRGVRVSWEVERADAIQAFTDLTRVVTPAAALVVDDLVQPQALMLRAMEQVDLDPVVAAALTDLDLDSVVAQLLEATDLNAAVQTLIERTDLEQAIGSGLEHLDITAVVLDHVDAPRLVDGLMSRLDTTRLVLDNVDVVALAQAVIEGVDLPRIVRESSGSIASETVESVRLQGIDADRAVARMVDRLLGRARGHVDPA